MACNDNTTGFTTENHYWRAFNMNTFTGGQAYDVTSVSFGIELAESGTGTGQPVTVKSLCREWGTIPCRHPYTSGHVGVGQCAGSSGLHI